jgi:membrane fusion protein, multidrug efflux system
MNLYKSSISERTNSMKTIFNTLSLLSLALLVSCQNAEESSIQQLIQSSDEQAIREKRAALAQERNAIDDTIDQLDQALAKMNTNTSLPLVAAVQAQSALFEHFVSLQGTVKTLQNVLIYPEMPGILKSISVRKGQQVKKNDLLAVLDDGGLAAQFEQAKSQLALAKTVFERQERLWKQEIGSEIQYLQAKTNFESAQGAVSALEMQYNKSVVRAPFDGLVDQVFKEPGVFVSPGPGAELFRIVNLDEVYVEVDVPEGHVATVKKGTKALVYLDALATEIEAEVSERSNVINPSNRSFKIEVALSNKEGAIKPNLTATVQLNDYSKQDAIMVLQSIVSENAEGQQYCFVIRNEGDTYFAERRIVQTGKTQGDFMEVLNGIKPGELLITEGAKKVTDGQQVQFINQ